MSINNALVRAWAIKFNREHHFAPVEASLRRLRFTALLVYGTLVFLAGRAFAGTNADAPTVKQPSARATDDSPALRRDSRERPNMNRLGRKAREASQRMRTGLSSSSQIEASSSFTIGSSPHAETSITLRSDPGA